MNKEALLEELTGEKDPLFISERENVIIDKCLSIINKVADNKCMHWVKVSVGFPRIDETGKYNPDLFVSKEVLTNSINGKRWARHCGKENKWYVDFDSIVRTEIHPTHWMEIEEPKD